MSEFPTSSTLENLATTPYRGVRAEIDLLNCELHLSREPLAEPIASLPLVSERRVAEPVLQAWGQGVSLLDPARGSQRMLTSWQPDLRYGLVVDGESSLLLQRDAGFLPYLMQTRQVIYPGQYTRRPGQGPFDLFASADGSWLTVVNRGEGWVQLFDLRQGTELARHHFKSLAGPKLISVAMAPERGRIWVCGLDDRQLWEWQPLAQQVKAQAGAGRQPSAVVWHQGGLWLLDASAPMRLRLLDAETLGLMKEWKLPASSYGKETDTPGDLLIIVGDKPWLALLGFENLPDPLTPKVMLFDPQSCQLSDFQPSKGQWPVMIAGALRNQSWLKLQAHSRELVGSDPAEAPSVKALMQSYGLRWESFHSRLLVIKAEQGPALDLPRGLRASLHEEVRKVLKLEHGLHLSETPRNDAERQLLVLLEQIVVLLHQHKRLEVVLYHLFNGIQVNLSLDRAQLLGGQGQETDLGELLSNMAEPSSSGDSIDIDPLPEGWAGLADALNSRLLQLNPALEPVWELDTTLIGVFRPAFASWLSDGSFALLDGDRSEVSAWDLQGNQLWAVQTDGSVWSRIVLARGAAGMALSLLDRDQQVLIQVNTKGEILWDADALPHKPQDMLDCCSDGEGGLWLLQYGGKLSQLDATGQLQRELQLPGMPASLALSRDRRRLALFDFKQQSLSLLQLESGACDQLLSLSEPRYRLQDPVQIHWTSDSELLLTDPFRLLRYRLGSKIPERMLLMQSLRRKPGQANLAPEAVYVARQQREAQLQGGSRASIRKMLEKVSLFEHAPEELYQDLIDCLQTRVYNRGELIVKKGEPGSEMFLLRQGQVEVLGANPGEVVARMGPGDVFGEVALMLGTPRNATIRAGGYAETFILEQASLDTLLPGYPELRERLFRLAQERATQQKLRAEDAISQLRSRVQSAQGTSRPAPAGLSLPGREAPLPAVELPALSFWVRHAIGNQLAELDRSGKVLRLFGPDETFLQPVAAQADGDALWLLDAGHHALFRLEGDQVTARYHDWGGKALNQPRAIAAGPDGSVWIANSGAGNLLQISRSGELLQAVSAGRAPASLQVLADGKLLVADPRQHTVSVYDAQGQEHWVYGTPRKFGRDENMLFAPEYAERLANGHTLIADTGNSRVLEVDAEGRIVWSLLAGGALRMSRPSYVERLANGNTLVGHTNQSRWLEVNPQMLPVWRHSMPAEALKA